MLVHLSYPFSRKTFDLFNILKSDYPDIKIYFSNRNSYIINFILKLVYPSAIFISKDEFINTKYNFILFPQEVEQIKYFNISKNNNLKYSFSNNKIIDICNNKDEFYKFCFENNIPHPLTFFESTLINSCENFILKPKNGSGSRGLKILYNFKGYLDVPSNYIAQIYIGNDNEIYGFFAFCENGQIINHYQHKRIITYPSKGGVSVYSELVYNNEILDISKLIIEKLNYSGLLMIEFKKHQNKFYVIEINPRLWGSLILTLNMKDNLLNSYLRTLGYRSYSNNTIFRSSILWIFPFIFYYPKLINYCKNSYLINFTKSNIFRSFLFLVILFFIKFLNYKDESYRI